MELHSLHTALFRRITKQVNVDKCYLLPVMNLAVNTCLLSILCHLSQIRWPWPKLPLYPASNTVCSRTLSLPYTSFFHPRCLTFIQLTWPFSHHSLVMWCQILFLTFLLPNIYFCVVNGWWWCVERLLLRYLFYPSGKFCSFLLCCHSDV